MSDKTFEATVGHVLAGIAVSEGEHDLRLEFADRKPHYVTTGGDCCSESWWADIIGAAGCYGARITGFRVLELPTPSDNRTRQESDVAYGFALDTEAGTVTLAFRNSSNGYYGGWATAQSEAPGGVSQWVNVETNDWRG